MEKEHLEMKQQRLVFVLVTKLPVHSAIFAAKSAPHRRASAFLGDVKTIENIEDPTIHNLCLAVLCKGTNYIFQFKKASNAFSS